MTSIVTIINTINTGIDSSSSISINMYINIFYIRKLVIIKCDRYNTIDIYTNTNYVIY